MRKSLIERAFKISHFMQQQQSFPQLCALAEAINLLITSSLMWLAHSFRIKDLLLFEFEMIFILMNQEFNQLQKKLICWCLANTC